MSESRRTEYDFFNTDAFQCLCSVQCDPDHITDLHGDQSGDGVDSALENPHEGSNIEGEPPCV